MTPHSLADWDVVSRHIDFLENDILKQVCIVYPGQCIPLWIHQVNYRTVVNKGC